MKKCLTILFACTILFNACSKDKTEPNNNNGNNNQPTKTPKELIVGAWKPISMMWNGTDHIESCAKDNIVTYRADGTYTLDQGATKCNPNAVQSQEGTWNLDSYPTFTTKLNSNPNDGTTVTIKTLDNSSLVYEQVESGQTYTITWKRI